MVEAWKFGFKKKKDLTNHAAKTKELISCAVTHIYICNRYINPPKNGLNADLLVLHHSFDVYFRKIETKINKRTRHLKPGHSSHKKKKTLSKKMKHKKKPPV